MSLFLFGSVLPITPDMYFMLKCDSWNIKTPNLGSAIVQTTNLYL